MSWLALFAGILVEVFSTLGLRASNGFRDKRWIAPVLIGYVVSFSLVWLALHLGMPVGIAYGVWSACGVALVALLARVFFGERLTPVMVAGIGLIIAGVLVIELSGAA
ncbi:MAG: DMT family transporter [Mycobacterium sp.]|jgi:small multidrug resistance pump